MLVMLFVFLLVMSIIVRMLIVKSECTKVHKDVMLSGIIVSRVLVFFCATFILASYAGFKFGAVIIISCLFAYAFTFLINATECKRLHIIKVW